MDDERSSHKIAYKVLFLDDEKKILEVARKLLSKTEYELLICDNPLEALKIVKNQGPISVVLSDNRMPDLKGAELFEKIKGLSPHTVRILTTAYYDEQLIDDAVNKGEVFRFLKKPLDFEQAHAAILAGLERYKKSVETADKESQFYKIASKYFKLKSKDEALASKVPRLERSIKILSALLVLLVLSFGGHEVYLKFGTRGPPEEQNRQVGDWIKYDNGTALDTRSGLMWMTRDFRGIEKRPPADWDEAMAWPDKMNKDRFGGYDNWRVPTISEYQQTYDPEKSRLAFDGKKDYPVGYPRVFEDGGGYGFWSSEQAGMDSAKLFFFIGGYDKTESKTYDHATMSVRLARAAS